MGLTVKSEIGSNLHETTRSAFGTGDTAFEFDGDCVAISGTFTPDWAAESQRVDGSTGG
ncbi:MAG: hypothetical protein J07HX64_02077 [halophilic archaeon J07HX64]|jgi:hypothetical protein|nr:MAG: hypothetical protein J07HX64_02077 [halophilic archaeon J07HX64]